MTAVTPSVAADRILATGPETGPPVVLVHGFASTAAADWPAERWADPLAAAGRTSLVVHLPGHGSAPAVTSADEVTTGRVVHQLAEAVAGAVGPEVDLVGYSLGARLCWDLAAAPGLRVRRLVLGGLSPMEPFGMVDLAAARAAVAGGPRPADPLTAVIAGMAGQPGRDAASLLTLVEGLAREPFDPGVRVPAVPTLFLAGVADPMAQGIETVAGRVPGARLEQVPGDHGGALQGDPFRAAVLGFLGIG
ncbi:alpha/beta fold hydrolase [Blastococcus sp. SYSU D00820]